jgi:ornithine cyclodeaminase/alanine dehydrogenase-like protein (mu-crystallin family)
VMLKAALPRLRRIVVTSRRPESRERIARELSTELGIEIAPVASTEEVLATVDAVVVSTSTKTPIVEERWLRPGCTIYSLGANQELDTPSYTKVDKFIADDWGQVQLKHDIVELMARKEFSEANVYGDLAEILGGRKPGRERSDERIVLRSEGLVTMDVALAEHLYNRALGRGLGQALDI